MGMNFVHEERLELKLFPVIKGDKVTSVGILSSEVVDAKVELKCLLRSEKDGYKYVETRTLEVGVPLGIHGEIIYVDEYPEANIKDDIGEISFNVKMQTEKPLTSL